MQERLGSGHWLQLRAVQLWVVDMLVGSGYLLECCPSKFRSQRHRYHPNRAFTVTNHPDTSRSTTISKPQNGRDTYDTS